MPNINFKFERYNLIPNATFMQSVYSGHNSVGNCLDHNDITTAGKNNRFKFPQVLDSIFRYVQRNPNDMYQAVHMSIDTPADHYIIGVGVSDCPEDWTGMTSDGKTVVTPSIFDAINPTYINDLRSHKAILVIDQSLEGYHKTWLWEWLHTQCDNYSIPTAALIYTTGDQTCAEQYKAWYTGSLRQHAQIKVIPSIALSIHIYDFYKSHNFNIKFDDVLQHKTDNATNIKLYDCTNLKFRTHRLINFLHLFNAGLLDDGKVSMDSYTKWPALPHDIFENYKLPSTILKDVAEQAVTPRWVKGTPDTVAGGYAMFITRIMKDMYLNTWISVVSESTFFEYEHSVFISEKTFKPIACLQPFIIVGSKGTLKYLRKLGYRTFDGFIDESYDDCEDTDRIPAVINAIKKIQAIPDKTAWYESMRDILEHNQKMLLDIETKKSIEHEELIKYYSNYFKE
jgi:hypothetical protein